MSCGTTGRLLSRACVFWICTSLQLFALCSHLTSVMLVTSVVVTSQAAAPLPLLPSPRNAASRPAPDSRCSVNDGMEADESACNRFLICQQGRARRMACGQDLRYNRDLGTCDYPSSVTCGTRPADSDRDTCYTAVINVTVRLENLVRQPHFQEEINFTAPRQPLRYILLIAAGMNPNFRHETHSFDGYGEYVSAFNGMENDVTVNLAVWQLYNKNQGVIVQSLDEYYPENDDVITYVYTDAMG